MQTLHCWGWQTEWNHLPEGFCRPQCNGAGTSPRQWKIMLSLADGVGDRDRVRPWRGRAQLGQEGHGGRRHLPRHLQVHHHVQQQQQHHHVLVAAWGHLVHSGRVFPGQEQEEERLALFAGFDDGHITSYDGHHLTHEKSWQAHKVGWVKKKQIISESSGLWSECDRSRRDGGHNLSLLWFTLWRAGLLITSNQKSTFPCWFV